MTPPHQQFSEEERRVLLALRGVGPQVLLRLEQLGISSLPQLAGTEIDDLLLRASELVGSTCWRNSPQARAALTSAVLAARESAVSRQS